MAQAVAAAQSALEFLAGADAGALPEVELADCLKALERIAGAQTVARARILAAFSARGVFEDDGARSAKSWLVAQTRVTRGAAGASMGWMRRLAVHPQIADALAAARISESWARQLSEWSDMMPPDVREDADKIFLSAACCPGLTLADLSQLAEEMYQRTAPPDTDDEAPPFQDRSLELALHYRGSGRLTGELTPECAAALSAVLEALSKKMGPEDDRTRRQRSHDALEEACRRLVGSGSGLPDSAGQPTQIQLHMTLSQLRDLAVRNARAGSPAPGQEAGPAGDGVRSGDTRRQGVVAGDGTVSRDVRAEDAWLAAGGTASGVPGWVSGAAAEGYACDAAVTPVVTGMIDPDVLDQLIDELALARPAGRDRRRIEELILHAAVGLLSGPGGLASRLRTSLAGTRLAGPSLPLDVGQTDKIPAHLRRLVAIRHPRCAFPGCGKRAQHCQVHHLIPRSEGGLTALDNLVPLCSFHHLIAIHRWGWNLVLHPDGTTTATSPDGRKILHSHGSPDGLLIRDPPRHGPPRHGPPGRDPPGRDPPDQDPPGRILPGHPPGAVAA
ncbi:MAG TPA: DUF222 domain-containing protein [Streptosporangiaceae bacterium]|jgi:hypothetical protein